MNFADFPAEQPHEIYLKILIDVMTLMIVSLHLDGISVYFFLLTFRKRALMKSLTPTSANFEKVFI